MSNSFNAFADQSLRIATWNLERPTQSSFAKNQRILEQLHTINADLWILTETNSAIYLPETERGYRAIESSPIQGYHKAGEHLVTLWSLWPVLRALPTYDPHWAVCAEVESPFGSLIVYGTVMIYADEPGQQTRWEFHRQAVKKNYQDWRQLRDNYPEHLFCIAGDFNQSLGDPAWYSDPESCETLRQAFQDLSLTCWTEKNWRQDGLSRGSIDHICLSEHFQSYVVDVKALEGKTPEGTKLSDHNGVYVALQLS